MVHIDLNKPDRAYSPGIDLWEIRECVAKGSSRGDQMLAIKMHRVADTSDHIYDNIMLEGGGWGIGKIKLLALLDDGFSGEIDPLSFVGKRLWVATVVDSYQGKDRLKVNIDELKHNGYNRETDVPPGHSLPDETVLPGQGDLPESPF